MSSLTLAKLLTNDLLHVYANFLILSLKLICLVSYILAALTHGSSKHTKTNTLILTHKHTHTRNVKTILNTQTNKKTHIQRRQIHTPVLKHLENILAVPENCHAKSGGGDEDQSYEPSFVE